MRKSIFILFLTLGLSKIASAETGCYVQLARQGIDDNTFYLEVGPSGSYEYTGAQYHPLTSPCISITATPCFVYRAPEPPYFPNGPQYDQGVLITYTQGAQCDLDGTYLLPMAVVLGFIFLKRSRKGVFISKDENRSFHAHPNKDHLEDGHGKSQN